MERMRCARFRGKRFPQNISQGATYEFLLYGKGFDIFYTLKRTPIFNKQLLCDNCTSSLTTSFPCPSSGAEGASGRKRLFYKVHWQEKTPLAQWLQLNSAWLWSSGEFLLSASECLIFCLGWSCELLGIKVKERNNNNNNRHCCTNGSKYPCYWGGKGGKVSRPTILDKINGKPRPPLPPKSRMGKWRVFALRAPSSLIWGGWGFAVSFYFVRDCSSRN